MSALDRTHDPARRSWLASANDPATDFPIQNLPLGVFRDAGRAARGGVAIGDRIVDLAQLLRSGLVSGFAAEAAAAATSDSVLNPLLRLGRPYATALRGALADLLDAELAAETQRAKLESCLMHAHAVDLLRPLDVPAFTDFLCSIDHTLRMGRNSLPPAFKHLPIAYNSRASSVVVSGTEVVRPNGQSKLDDAVTYGPEPWLDFELELGAYIGTGNDLGVPVDLPAADGHIFGYSLLNDWSARGIQFFESMPLGPFLGKSFCTSISPWVVTADALAPYRVAARERPGADAPPPHLDSSENQVHGALDVTMEAYLLTPRMREAGAQPFQVTRAQFREMYWTFAQMLAHHTSNGCNLQVGDLLGSGTVSGPVPESRACLAELTSRGSETLQLPHGEIRTWLEDGDEVIFRGYTARSGFPRIGFGECRGRIISLAGNTGGSI